ncbi:MAG: hypothetical protein R2748_22255 [Bryobacterales bacterium]
MIVILLLPAIPILAFWILPFLPIGLLPPYGRSWQASDMFPRLFVASLAATQPLQVYPVAGSQIGIAASPLILWALLCIYDGTGAAVEVARNSVGGDSRPVSRHALLSGFLALTWMTSMVQPSRLKELYRTRGSDLPGSASLHLQPDVEAKFVFLAGDIRNNCDVLFTLPGMGSLNLWSGVPTPNGWNLTGWMKGFSADRQKDILEILRRNPRGCAVYNARLVEFWGSEPGDLDELPLARYIMHDMEKVAERDGYEIRAPGPSFSVGGGGPTAGRPVGACGGPSERVPNGPQERFSRASSML